MANVRNFPTWLIHPFVFSYIYETEIKVVKVSCFCISGGGSEGWFTL